MSDVAGRGGQMQTAFNNSAAFQWYKIVTGWPNYGLHFVFESRINAIGLHLRAELARTLLFCEQIRMRQTTQPINRRKLRRLFAAVAVLSLVLWLFMLVAEAWTPLHAWLHGGTIPDNDNCAVTAFAHGQVDSASFDIPVPVSIVWVEVSTRAEIAAFHPSISFLPGGRAPPVLLAVS